MHEAENVGHQSWNHDPVPFRGEVNPQQPNGSNNHDSVRNKLHCNDNITISPLARASFASFAVQILYGCARTFLVSALRVKTRRRRRTPVRFGGCAHTSPVYWRKYQHNHFRRLIFAPRADAGHDSVWRMAICCRQPAKTAAFGVP